MGERHSLLKRQLRRCFGDDFSIPAGWQQFIEAVDSAYQEFDVDRGMLERSLELSSQELLQANSKLRAIFQAIPDLLFRLDREGTVLAYEGGEITRFFLQPKDLLGKRIQDIPVKNVGDMFREAIHEVQKSRSIVSREYSLTRPGQELFYEVRLLPLLEDQIIVIVRDISERKQAEEELKKHRDHLEILVKEQTAELRQANEQLAALYKVGQLITRPLQLNVVLDVIARSTAELLDTDTGVILLVDEGGETLSIKGAYGLSEAVVEGTRDRIGESIAGRVVEAGQPIIANDLPNDPRFFNPAAAEEGLLACASVPLVIGEKIIGTLDVHSKSNRQAFNEDHIQVLNMLASQAAIAIENARLYEELQQAHDKLEVRVQQRTVELAEANVSLKAEIAERKRIEAEIQHRNRELTLLNRVIAASATETKQKAILELTCRELVVAFEVSQAAALLVNEAATEMVVVAEHPAKEGLVWLNKAVPVEGNPVAQYLLTHKAPLIANDAQNDPRLILFHDLLRERGTVSLLIVPLVPKDEGVGGLWLEASEPRDFTPEEVGLAWNVANQVAGALARIRFDQERRRLEAQYHQAQKMEAIGLLAGGIAHDFNNLLTSINGFAELVRRELEPDDPLREMMDSVLNSGRRGADLVRQLLVFSRKQVVVLQALDLSGVVTNIEKMLQRIIGEHIRMETTLQPELWSVKADPAQMEQVIVNLAVNARDAMPEGGHLTIELANVVLDENYVAGHLGVQPGEYVLLAVSDSGCGMNDEVKAHLFEPFFTTKEMGKGTGLGLATVFGIVEQSGGDIWVYSEEGVGTTFKIYLPRAVETAQGRFYLDTETEIPTGSETILLVEDDADVRSLARLVLQKQGYAVLEAWDGQEALKVAKRHAGPIHLLLTDVVMPGMSGRKLAEQLAQIQPGLKTLFMSGYTDQAITRKGELEPGVAFLQKPYSPPALAHKVRAVLDG